MAATRAVGCRQPGQMQLDSGHMLLLKLKLEVVLVGDP